MNILIEDVIDGLTELRDKEAQEKLWLHGDEEISSFTEAICGVFDDGGVSRALDKGEVDEPLASLFRRLDSLVAKVPEHSKPDHIIAHPAMEDVRTVAGELLKALRESSS